MRLATLMLSSAALLLPAAGMSASVVCPALNSSANSTYVSAGGGCNVLITINSNNTVTITTPNSHPYDGVEDTYVGVVNNSSSSLSSLSLSSSAAIFGFDGDGIDTFGISSNGHDTSGYGGADSFFSGINAGQNTGTVDFLAAIAGNGGTGYFSLEEPPTTAGANLVVGTTPEPGSLVLLGTGLLGFAGTMKRRLLK